MKLPAQMNPMRGMAIVILTVGMPFSFLFACNGDNKERVEIVFDPQTSYTVKEINVMALISDSGITRYKLTTPTWLIYGKASEPFWYFPDGVYVEKFDTLFNIEASIKADEAYNYQRRKLWEANGNVDITNFEGVRFQTSQLFWDEQNETFYTDSFIHITKKDMINTGIGFRSNKDLSVWEIYNSSAEIMVEEQRHDKNSDSIPPPDLSTNE